MFITPFGRFKFLRASFGLSSISEHYNSRMHEDLEGLDGFQRIVDDNFVYDTTWAAHIAHVRELLHQFSERGISPNQTKFCSRKKTSNLQDFAFSWQPSS